MKESTEWAKLCIDPAKIEGYERAISDPSDTRYHCHHRYETHTSDGIIRSVPLSRDELKALDMYYNRPAEELIILTAREHAQLHRLSEGKNNYASKEEAKVEQTKQIKQWHEEHAEYKKQWRKEHQAEQAEYSKQYYEEHKAECCEQMKQYYEEHKAECCEQMKQYYEEHKAERAEYRKQYYEEHKAECCEQMKQRYEANLEYNRRQSKVSKWIKRNPTSTNFPKSWDEEDIRMFYELSK